MNDNDYQKYVKVFETWNENRTPLTLRWKDEEYTYYPDSSEEFRPCYLETIPESEQVRFFKARNEMPKNWWVSDRGTIIRIIGNENDGYQAALYYGQGEKRLQVRIKEQAYAREAIVGIVFEDKIPWIDEKAAECIEKYGLAAFRRNGEGIEVHHCKGYATFSSRTEAMNNLKINCDLNNIRFLPANVHKVLGYIQPNMKRLYSDTETIEDIHAINEALVRADVKETTIVSPGASGRQGDIRCLGDTVTTLDGRQMSFENAIKDMLQGMILKKIN